jgi:hypothetical protein
MWNRTMTLALVFAAAALCQAPTPVKTARDQATLEQYVRQVFGPTVELKVSALKPSATLPGFYQANIHGTGTGFDQVRPILSKFLVKNIVFKGEGFSVEMKLTSPQNIEAMRIPQESFVFDVPVFVSGDGQRILIGEVFDLTPKK